MQTFCSIHLQYKTKNYLDLYIAMSVEAWAHETICRPDQERFVLGQIYRKHTGSLYYLHLDGYI